MIRREYINKKEKEKYVVFEDNDFEYEKPVKHYGDFHIITQMVLLGIPNEELDGVKPPSEESKQILIEAITNWNEMLANFKKIELPKELIQIFDTKKKKEQIDLLKKVVLNTDILMAFLIKAEELGYTLSQYTSEYHQKGLDFSKMPLAYEVKDDGSVEKMGKTELSDGQLKQAIEHRKITVAKFLDKGDMWHCFFATYKSFRGEEIWLGENQPHYHYISSAFGIEREKVVEQLKSEKYKLGNLPHIKLEDYGNQPKK
jgi:hypothetical protein